VLLFLFAVIVISFSEKKRETQFLLTAVLFKTDFFMELGISLLFPKGKRRSKQDFPLNNVNFKLKSGFIHLLQTFNGLTSEDPHNHLKEFHMVCVGMKPNGVDEEQVKLKVFPFSLKGAAKAWFFSILQVLLELGMHKEDFP
jgi:hypothetical protein